MLASPMTRCMDSECSIVADYSRGAGRRYMDVGYAGSLLPSRRPPRMCLITAFIHAGCARLLPSLILALVMELVLQRISGAVSPSDMFPVILGMTGSFEPPSISVLLAPRLWHRPLTFGIRRG